MQLTRRAAFTAGVGVAGALMTRQAAAWTPSPSYPDPAVEIIDPSFAKYRVGLAAVERLATGFRWCEGPVWFGDQRQLLWSDIPNNKIMRWSEQSGEVEIFRNPANYTNGHSRDNGGRLISCENLFRQVTRTEYGGSITVLAGTYEGKRLNAPNDIVSKSDGSIWFTDPTFGISGNYEGRAQTPELPESIYRLDPDGTLTLLTTAIAGPNGLCFTPDESTFYVVEAKSKPNRLIWAFDVAGDGKTISNGHVLIDAGAGGTPDGMRCDVDGNLWVGWGMGKPELNGVYVYNPQGVLIGRILLPERCGNLCFGGAERNRLFMAASQSIYSLYVNTQGAVAF